MHFHIQEESKYTYYTKEKINHTVEVIANIVNCGTEEILVNGVEPPTSFSLVLSLKEAYILKLSNMNEKDRLRLMKLNIDFLSVDENTITLNSPNGNLKITLKYLNIYNLINCYRNVYLLFSCILNKKASTCVEIKI